MTDINTNSRLLRSSEEGFFNQGGSVVCRSCGIQKQCARQKTRTVCFEFVPILTFRAPLIGLSEWSNTFRLSSLWYERLKGRIGHTVAYYDTKGPKLIGHAKLTGVAHGTMDQMLERYAWSNHLSLGSGISKEDAPDWLREKLMRNYKTMFKHGDGKDPMTVIFSARLRGNIVRRGPSDTEENPEVLHSRQAG